MKIPAAILNLLLLCGASAIGADDRSALAALQSRVARLEEEVQRTEAIRAVKRLQYAYGHYAELGLWNDLADLFAENGVGHYPSGTLGKEAIRKLFLQDVGKGMLGLVEGQLYPHIMLEPVVTLASDGKSAKGRWRVFAMLGSFGGSAVWAGGIYENDYVLEKGFWKIQDLHYYPRFSGRYEDPGWTVAKGEIPIHYDPARAGKPVLEIPGAPANAQASPTLATLSNRLADLTRRAQWLNDENEVENLQGIYGYYVDRKMWDDVADLFAEDATVELGLQGVYAGKASIRRALDQFGPAGLREGELNDHLQLQTIVHVAPDGRSAKARGVELTMSGVNGVGGEWSEGVFENEFTKQNGVWKIKSLHFYPRLRTDCDRGWGEDAKPAPGPNENFPPDRPPTARYEIFPKFYIAPFHFNNPATGRATQYPKGTKAVVGPSNPQPAVSVSPAFGTIVELTKGIAEAERRLKVAAAYDAAENIAGAYGYYLDEFMWDETADLFTINAGRDLSSVGSDNGRESIRQSLKKRYPGKKPTEYVLVHQLIQPVIHVAQDGQSAKMRVRLFQLAGPSGGSGSWIAGVYETETAVEDGVWKLKALDLKYTWTADYKGGWAHIDPNRKGLILGPFPKIADLPFHYKNPVTGRTPPLFVP